MVIRALLDLWISTRSSRPLDQVFVGRTNELERIAGLVATARSGHPQVLSVEGEAGSGKSALVRRVVADLGDATVLRFEADELAREVPFALFTPFVTPAQDAGDFEAGLELLTAVAERADDQLVVVVVEDLHWADDHSRAALATMVRRLDREPVLVLTTTRTEAPSVPDVWERLRQDAARVETIRLDDFTWHEVADLAVSHGVRLGEPAARRLHDHTRGNALYTEMLLRELPESVLTTTEGLLPAPSTLAATTVALAAGLPTDAMSLLAALVVLNRPTELPTLALVSSVAAPLPALEDLVDAGLVRWDGERGVPIATISHPLFRAAIYDELAPTTRQQLHRAAAAVSDHRGALAHRVAAADHLDDELAAELEATAEADRGELGAAGRARLWRWSAELSADRAERERRLLTAAHLLAAADDAALAELEPDIEACRADPRKDLVLSQLAWREGKVGDAERLARAAADASDPVVRGEALVALASQLVPRGRGPEAIEAATGALDIGIGLADEQLERLAWAYLVLGLAMVQGAPEALATMRERLPDAPSMVATADAGLLAIRGMLATFAGRPTAAVDDLRAVTRDLRSGVTATVLRRSHAYLAHAEYLLGRWDDAAIDARLALELVDAGHRWEDTLGHQVLAEVAAGRGRWDEAEGHVAAAVESAKGNPMLENALGAKLAAMALHAARGENAALLEMSPAPGEPPMMSALEVHPVAVAALIDAGHLDEAARLLDTYERLAAERGLSIGLRRAGLRGRLAAASGDPVAAAANFEQAMSSIGPDDAVLRIVEVRFAYGLLLRSQGQRQLAVEQWRLARELLEPLGAEPYLARIDAELSEAGLRRTTRRRGSPLDLTPREQDVMALAARGHTNKEIAAELYISVKAVEYHLRNVFGKLGISSRRELQERSDSRA